MVNCLFVCFLVKRVNFVLNLNWVATSNLTEQCRYLIGHEYLCIYVEGVLRIWFWVHMLYLSQQHINAQVCLHNCLWKWITLFNCVDIQATNSESPDFMRCAQTENINMQHFGMIVARGGREKVASSFDKGKGRGGLFDVAYHIL